MNKPNTKLAEQNDPALQPDSEVDDAVSRGAKEIPSDKFEAFKTTMAKMHQAVTQVGTAASMPAKAAGQAQPPKKPGETQAAGVTNPTRTAGSQTAGARAQASGGKQGTNVVQVPSGGTVDISWTKGDPNLTKSVQEVIKTLTDKNPNMSKKDLDRFVNVMQNLNVHGLKVVPQ